MQMSFLLEYCHYLQREYRNSYLSSYRNLIEVLHLSVIEVCLTERFYIKFILKK